MNIHYFFIAWFLLSAVANILLIGKKRVPITPGVAAINVALSVGFAAWLAVDAGVLG